MASLEPVEQTRTPAAPRRALALFTTRVDQAAAARSAHRPRTLIEWHRFAIVALQLVLAVWVIDTFQIQNRAFARLMIVVLCGFVTHALLPVRLRLAFLVLLSMYGITEVLCPVRPATFGLDALRPALWLVGIGVALIGIACAPLSLRVRVTALAAAGIGLALLRADWMPAPWPASIWPILGSLFMFRMIVFLYDRHHGERARSVWETLSYFFLLPNVCFPLFPVVDYKTYRRSYYAEDTWVCAQAGVRWIMRGIVQLLAYRYVYYYGVLAPSEVLSGGDLVRYIVTTFALYLRVSGSFHLAVGILRLFGFALPETHFLYFLSSSVNDFWRRANIYWKDFMVKLFYYPAFFRLRHGGQTRAFVLATLVVVLATWSLHSYQWFWLQGTFPITWQDGVFWGTLGTMMVLNTLREDRRTRARGRRVVERGPGAWLARAASVVVTFAFLSTLWSLWSSDSFASWTGAWTAAFEGGFTGGTTSAAVSVLLPVSVLAALIGGASVSGGLLGTARRDERAFARSAVFTSSALLGLALLGQPQVYGRLGESASEIVQSLRVAKLNRIDAESLQRGYYEDLLDVDRLNPELWNAYRAKPDDWFELHETRAMRPTDDFLLTELVPSLDTPYKGAVLRTNSFGMRDLEYARQKPAGTWRAALLGASYVMGSGVHNDETFEAVIERRLNEQPLAEGRRYEILNFSVGGYSPMQRAWMLEHRALAFEPDAVLYIAHENEDFRVQRHLAAARARGIEPPWPELTEIYARAGVDASTASDLFEKRLEPYTREILAITLSRLARTCREHDIVPVWVLLPTLEMAGDPAHVGWLVEMAEKAGFVVITLFDVYRGHDIFEIRVADWDYHPNRIGHRVIADRLLQEMLQRAEALRLR